MKISYYEQITNEKERKEKTILFVIASQEILKDFAKELLEIKNMVVGDSIYLALGNILDSVNGSDLFSEETEFLDFKNEQTNKLYDSTNYSLEDLEYIYEYLKKNIENFNDLIIRMQEDFNGNKKFIQEYYDFALIKNLIF